MYGRQQQFRHAIALGVFGVLGLAFFFVVAGIAGRARGRDHRFPYFDRGARIRVVGDGPVPGRAVVGGTGGGSNRSPADVGASGGGSLPRRPNFASEETLKGDIP
jgi:hypothetical protein